jgi:hypothetical protein
MILFDVVKRFDQACSILVERRMVPIPPGISNEEIMRLLMDHERRNLCVNNVCEQVASFEANYKRAKQTPQRVAQLIAAAAQLYVMAVLEHRRQQVLSHAEQKRLASEGSLHKEVADLVKDNTHVRRLEGGIPTA